MVSECECVYVRASYAQPHIILRIPNIHPIEYIQRVYVS